MKGFYVSSTIIVLHFTSLWTWGNIDKLQMNWNYFIWQRQKVKSSNDIFSLDGWIKSHWEKLKLKNRKSTKSYYSFKFSVLGDMLHCISMVVHIIKLNFISLGEKKSHISWTFLLFLWDSIWLPHPVVFF